MFLNAFMNVFLREMKRLFTNKDLLMICFAAPFVYGIALSAVYSQKRAEDIPVGIVDRDNSRLSRAFVRMMDATPNIRVKERYTDAPAAIDDMIAGDLVGLLYIPRGFSSEIKSGRDAMALVSINSANFVVANPVMQSLLESASIMSAGAFVTSARKRGLVKEKALTLAQPLALDTRPIFNPQVNYSDFFIPGLLFMVIQQIMLVGLGYTVAEELENNREEELRTLCGGNIFALFAGKSLPYALVNYGIGIVFLFGLLPVFDITVQSSIPGVLLLLALFIGAITSFGVMISAFFRSVVMALAVLMFYSMPVFLISGAVWPSFSLPLSLRLLSYLFPSTYFLVDFRMLILGDVPFRYVLPSCGALILFGSLCGMAACALFKRMAGRP